MAFANILFQKGILSPEDLARKMDEVEIDGLPTPLTRAQGPHVHEAAASKSPQARANGGNFEAAAVGQAH